LLNITLICVGKLKEKFYKEACEEYAKRLSGLCRFELIELKEEKGEKELEKEAEAIREVLPTGAAVIAMCIEGKLLSSEVLSQTFSDLALKGNSRLVLLIGSSVGLDESIKKQAILRLSMSPMTFPHHLARVMVLEQVYRALMIAEGRSYHK